MHENEYLHNAREVFDLFRIYPRQKCVFFLTKIYLKPLEYISYIVKAFILLHTFALTS